jgi:hypothetical protein
MANTPTEFGGTSRDLRIDFFRGLALYMIIFDHVPGDPISKLTYAHLGFSDAAEIFVFLSGVSCGIVYPRVLSRRVSGGCSEPSHGGRCRFTPTICSRAF